MFKRDVLIQMSLIIKNIYIYQTEKQTKHTINHKHIKQQKQRTNKQQQGLIGLTSFEVLSAFPLNSPKLSGVIIQG